MDEDRIRVRVTIGNWSITGELDEDGYFFDDDGGEAKVKDDWVIEEL